MSVNLISRPDVALKNKSIKEKQTVISAYLSKFPTPADAVNFAKNKIDTAQDLPQLKSNLNEVFEEIIKVIYALGK
jgi:hypothetical protein